MDNLSNDLDLERDLERDIERDLEVEGVLSDFKTYAIETIAKLATPITTNGSIDILYHYIFFLDFRFPPKVDLRYEFRKDSRGVTYTDSLLELLEESLEESRKESRKELRKESRGSDHRG